MRKFRILLLTILAVMSLGVFAQASGEYAVTNIRLEGTDVYWTMPAAAANQTFEYIVYIKNAQGAWVSPGSCQGDGKPLLCDSLPAGLYTALRITTMRSDAPVVLANAEIDVVIEIKEGAPLDASTVKVNWYPSTKADGAACYHIDLSGLAPYSTTNFHLQSNIYYSGFGFEADADANGNYSRDWDWNLSLEQCLEKTGGYYKLAQYTDIVTGPNELRYTFAKSWNKVNVPAKGAPIAVAPVQPEVPAEPEEEPVPEVPAPSADPGLANFKTVNTYTAGQFADVASTYWGAPNIAKAFELGLMKGSSDSAFDPEGSVTVAQTVTMAARLHSIYTTGSENFVQSGVWYQTYVDYCKENGILKKDFADYNAPAKRSDFAAILVSALPEEALNAINAVTSIPDVTESSENGAAIYALYRAGILTGNDAQGTFGPETSINRAAAAAILTRMADTSLRKSVTLTA